MNDNSKPALDELLEVQRQHNDIFITGFTDDEKVIMLSLMSRMNENMIKQEN